MKKRIFLLSVILTALAVSAAAPLSAAAVEAEETIAAVAEPAEETQAPDSDAIVPTAIEPEPVPVIDYPVITGFENQNSGVKITWDSYDNNTYYRVYYRKAASYTGSWEDKYGYGGWTRLATVRGNSYLHTAVKDAEIGLYTVRCVDGSGQFTSGFSADGWENGYYAPPEITSIRFDEEGVTLTWNNAWQKHGENNGERYRVYRKTAGNSWTRIADNLTESTYFDPTAQPGTTYIYTVRMVNEDGSQFLSGHTSGKSVSFDAYPLVTSIENTDKGAKLSWLKYSGASKYRVYYRTEGGWTRIAQVTGTSYVDTSAKNDENRVYTVRALDAKDNFISDFKHEGWTNCYFSPPAIQSIANTTEGVKLSWNRAQNAEDYRVYRKTTGGWTRLTQTGDSTFTDTTAVSGTKYTYTLRMISYDGERFLSDYLSGKSITYVAAPYITSAENRTDGVRITWDKVTGASLYRVYYRGESGWTRITQTDRTEYTDTTVSDGETREYTIRCLDGKENFVSDFYRDGYVNTFYTPPKIDSLYVTGGGVAVEWKRAPGAEDYRVYRRTADTSWTRLTQTDESRYIDMTAEKGVRYYYTLRMVKTDGEYFMSSYTAGTPFIVCETPMINAAESGEDGVVLHWNAVDNAYAYRIYYKTGSQWTRLATVHDTAYTDKQIAHNETREYIVRCVDEQGNFNSDYARVGVSQAYYAPPAVTAVEWYVGFNLIEWEDMPDALSYRLYRKQLGDEDWTPVGGVLRDTIYIDNNVLQNGIYTYTAQAVYADQNKSCLRTNTLYYRDGTPVDGVIEAEGSAYRFVGGKPAEGFFREGGKQVYYSGGVRVDQGWYKNKLYAQQYTPAQWLYALMTLTGDAPAVDPDDATGVCELAAERGLIDACTPNCTQKAVTRRFAAQTLVKALGYEKRSVGYISDLEADDSDLATIAYYGYFLPDNNNCIYPDKAVTAAEFDVLLSELHLYQLLHGKTIVSFGDSIMHGAGNNNQGITQMIGEKYGVYYHDYSANGAVMGQAEAARGHIPTHVRKAIAANQQADIILVNGGTNDMMHTALGEISAGYDLSDAEEATYSAGFEKAMWLITENWKDTPVIYIRAHNMNLVADSTEQKYGNRALAIAEKWNAAAIDMYNDSGLNTENTKMCDRYTYKNNPAFAGKSDSIHPNALGYAAFYLPAVSQKLAMLFNG